MAERSTYATFRRRLVVGFALLIALLVCALFWKIDSGYKAQRAAAFSQTKSFAQAMSAHVASEMRVVDLSLQRSVQALSSLDSGALRDPRRIREILALSASVSDANFWIHFLDASGAGVVASNGLSILGVPYDDRPYFSVHAGDRDLGLYIGAPEVGRVSKRRLFFLSRAVRSANGALLGVVVAPVDAAALADVFNSALFQAKLSITLLHGDGRVIARAPLFESAFAQDLASSELYRRWRATASGSYEGRSMVDRQRRVFSYQTVGQLPLCLAVGIASESWVDALSRDIGIAAGALVVIALVLLSCGGYVLRAYRRIESSDANQRALNTQLRLARDETARGERRIRMIADSLPALVAYIDADERYVFHNSFYQNIPGVDVNNIVGRTMREVLGDDIYQAIKGKICEALSGAQTNFEQTMTSGALERHLSYTYTPDFNESGQVVGFYTMVIDATDAKHAQESLRDFARTDGLTGLPNRSRLRERLGDALARARRNGYQVACLYLDIDHFKTINDTLGHAGGDEALKQFAARLRDCVRETDLVARLAGDEFVVVLEGLGQPAAAHCIAAKIISAMKAPFLIAGTERAVSTSVGIAVADGEHDDIDSVLGKADAALYQAKREGRGGYSMGPAPRKGAT